MKHCRYSTIILISLIPVDVDLQFQILYSLTSFCWFFFCVLSGTVKKNQQKRILLVVSQMPPLHDLLFCSLKLIRVSGTFVQFHLIL